MGIYALARPGGRLGQPFNSGSLCPGTCRTGAVTQRRERAVVCGAGWLPLLMDVTGAPPWERVPGAGPRGGGRWLKATQSRSLPAPLLGWGLDGFNLLHDAPHH